MNNFNLTDFVDGIHLKDEIWYSDNSSEVSYPSKGNEDCMQIEDNSFWFRHRNKCLISLVKHFSPDKKFWDIGGGNGFVSSGLQNNGIESILVEPGPSGAANGKRRGIRNIICATLENIRLKPDSMQAAGIG